MGMFFSADTKEEETRLLAIADEVVDLRRRASEESDRAMLVCYIMCVVNEDAYRGDNKSKRSFVQLVTTIVNHYMRLLWALEERKV